MIKLLGILTTDAMISKLEQTLSLKKMLVRLKQKVSASKISDIHAKFDQEKTAVRNEINSLDKKEQQDEYQDLMAELKELKDEEDEAVKVQEETANDYEERIQIETDNDEVRLEAMREDNKALKEANDKDVQDSFSYFK